MLKIEKHKIFLIFQVMRFEKKTKIKAKTMLYIYAHTYLMNRGVEY
jgi:hypothetical protein